MKVHPRIRERHPGISEYDVRHAWENYVEAAVREPGVKEVRTGFDAHGRELEMVGVMTADGWVVYHALTPPTKKFRCEVDATRRRR